MTGIVINVYKYLKRLLNEKGQDIVEYALLGAFCVAVCLFARNAGFSEVFKSSYDAGKPGLLTAAIGTKNASEGNANNDDDSDWGHKDPNTFDSSTSQARLEADQLFLANIAKYFIGKEKSYVKGIFNNEGRNEGGRSADIGFNEVVHLGWFLKSSDGGTTFVNVNPNNPDLKTALDTNELQNIFSWGLGHYNTVSGNNPEYDSTNRYLISDYSLSQGWTDNYNFNVQQSLGLKLRLEYDSTKDNNKKKVIAARIALDPASQNKQNGSSEGLEITIGSDGQPTVTKTGLAKWDKNSL